MAISFTMMNDLQSDIIFNTKRVTKNGPKFVEKKIYDPWLENFEYNV